MWKLFFEVCDFLCNFIPSKSVRGHIRTTRLYDYRKKYHALRRAYPDLNFRRTKMIKGGWNIGFIVDRKYVFKIRKFFDNSIPTERIMREKRITDAFASVSPVRIPRIEIVRAGEYTFYKYDFIPGKNLNTFRLKTISDNSWKWGRQLAQFITAVHNTRPAEIEDLRMGDGDGWNHNDICNNIIVDKKTMNIVGLIDWEYAGWGTLETEFRNVVAFSKKMQESGISVAVMLEYYSMNKTSPKPGATTQNVNITSAQNATTPQTDAIKTVKHAGGKRTKKITKSPKGAGTTKKNSSIMRAGCSDTAIGSSRKTTRITKNAARRASAKK